MVGMVINPIVGVYIPIIRIPIKGGMTIPNIATFDHATYKPLPPQKWYISHVLEIWNCPATIKILGVATINLRDNTLI